MLLAHFFPLPVNALFCHQSRWPTRQWIRPLPFIADEIFFSAGFFYSQLRFLNWDLFNWNALKIVHVSEILLMFSSEYIHSILHYSKNRQTFSKCLKINRKLFHKNLMYVNEFPHRCLKWDEVFAFFSVRWSVKMNDATSGLKFHSNRVPQNEFSLNGAVLNVV